MASNVGTILAAAAAGGGPKVVDIALRFRTDPANGAVVKQLSDQINDAVRKVNQGIDAATHNLVASANQSAKSLGDAMCKALERVSAKHSEISTKMESEIKAVSQAHRQGAAEAERDFVRQAQTEATLTKQAEQSAVASLDRIREHRRKKAGEGKQEQLNNGLKQFGEVTSEAGGLIKDIALATASKEAAEQLAQSLEKFDHIFGIFEHGLKVFAGINEALVTMKKYAAAAAVEQRLLAAAQAGVASRRRGGGGVGAAGTRQAPHSPSEKELWGA